MKSVDTTAGPIPAQYIEFCKTVARLAREAGLDSVSLTIRPGFLDQWNDPVQMNWEQGRHGDDSRNMAISSTVMIRANLDAPTGTSQENQHHG